MPRRWLILGNSGSGKSTLAQRLAKRYQIPLFDLDTIAWQQSELPIRKTMQESGASIDAFTKKNAAWIIEGCYGSLIAYTAMVATGMIFLCPGVEQSLRNCERRPYEAHKYASLEAQNARLGLLLEWVAQYERRTDEFGFHFHQNVFQKFAGDKVRIPTNDAAVKWNGF